MNLLNKIKSIFVSDTPEYYRIAEKVILKMSFRKTSTCAYFRQSWSGEQLIYFMNGGMKIKTYGNGYSDSEFLNDPLDDKKKIENFVASN
jgi:hypothetical protein